ncbi:hypothetical protein APHAL10511_008713, partial [Amanita phalloides]
MFQYGGLVGDNETDQVKELAIKSNQKRAAKASGSYSMIKVEANPEVPPKNMKEARNGDKNWKLTHLPDHTQTESLFKTIVMTEVHKKVGILKPWAMLGVEDVQAIIEQTFPGKGYKVAEDNAWYQLMKACLESWHNHFVTNAMQTIKGLLESNNLTTPESIVKEVKLHLDSTELKVTPEYTYKTFQYQWSQWNEDPTQRRGFGQSDLVLYTFAVSHLTYLSKIEIEDLMNERPIGALILLMQAVGWAFELWKMGVLPKTPPKFSKENFGDKFEHDQKDKQCTKHICHATLF